MKQSPYFQILRVLVLDFGKEVDISNKILSFFSNENEHDEYFDNRTILAEKLLVQMKENKHIDYSVTLLNHKEGQTVRPTKFTASLTAFGYDFYKQHQNIFWTRVIAWIAIGISVVAACFSGWQAKNSDTQSLYKTSKSPQEYKQLYPEKQKEHPQNSITSPKQNNPLH